MPIIRLINQNSAFLVALVCVAVYRAFVDSSSFPLVIVLALLLSWGWWRVRPRQNAKRAENLPTLLVLQSRY